MPSLLSTCFNNRAEITMELKCLLRAPCHQPYWYSNLMIPHALSNRIRREARTTLMPVMSSPTRTFPEHSAAPCRLCFLRRSQYSAAFHSGTSSVPLLLLLPSGALNSRKSADTATDYYTKNRFQLMTLTVRDTSTLL